MVMSVREWNSTFLANVIKGMINIIVKSIEFMATIRDLESVCSPLAGFILSFSCLSATYYKVQNKLYHHFFFCMRFSS